MTLIDSLLEKPRRAQVLFATNVVKFHDPALVRALLDKSWELRFENPGEMLHLANLAKLIAPCCKGDERDRLDLLGEAWTHFANALKIRGVLRFSQNAFGKAETFLRHTQCKTLHALYLECFGALRLRQERFPEARSFLVEALAIREQLGELGAIAAVLNQMAIAECKIGKHVAALQYLSRANRLIPWGSDPRLCLVCRHNSIDALAAMGRSVEALNLYERLQPVYAIAGDRMLQLRGQWLFAQIAASFGRVKSDETAETAFRATAQTAIELQLPYESGKVLFELGSFFASRRRWYQLEMVLVESFNLLDHLGISRESGLARVLLLAGRDRARSQSHLSRARRLLIRHHFAAAAAA